MRFVDFVNFDIRNHPKAVRSALDPASGKGNPFTEIRGQVTRLDIFFSAMNNPFCFCFFSVVKNDAACIPLNAIGGRNLNF